MDKMLLLPGSWLLLLTLMFGGCANQSLSGNAVTDTPPAIGEIERHLGSVHLVPVPLYGLPELSLGARWQEGKPLLLELCDSRNRNLQPQKPLVVYLDGELAYLKPAGKGVGGCNEFAVTENELASISSGKRVILRVFFDGEVVEQRVSGTTSDYFSRPKFYGPQSRMKQFIEALPKNSAENQLVGG